MRKEKITIHNPPADIDMEVRTAPILDTPAPPKAKKGKEKKQLKISRARFRFIVGVAINMLSRYAYVHEVIAILTKKFTVNRVTAKKACQKARQLIPKFTINRDAMEWRQRSIAFWQSIARDPGLDMSVRMQAQSKIDAIMGHDAPIKIETANAHFHQIEQVRKAALADPATLELMAELAEKVGGLSFITPDVVEDKTETETERAIRQMVNGDITGSGHGS